MLHFPVVDAISFIGLMSINIYHEFERSKDLACFILHGYDSEHLRVSVTKSKMVVSEQSGGANFYCRIVEITSHKKVAVKENREIKFGTSPEIWNFNTDWKTFKFTLVSWGKLKSFTAPGYYHGTNNQMSA